MHEDKQRVTDHHDLARFAKNERNWTGAIAHFEKLLRLLDELRPKGNLGFIGREGIRDGLIVEIRECQAELEKEIFGDSSPENLFSE